MASKVFLFDSTGWLYCSDVSFEYGVWRGWVENGAWHLVYNTVDNSIKSYRDSADERADYLPVTESKTTLTWMCDRGQGNGRDYNEVIADAEKRYNAKEPTNDVIGVDKNFALYQKLKAKYENDDQYDLYLELREKYEDDGIPF
jgi:hypothetical protein